MSEKNFFVENAFGEVYAGTFFADDFPKQPNNPKRKTTEEVRFDEATSRVRMSTEGEIRHKVTEKINSMYGLENLGGGSLFPTFNGRILGSF